MRILVWTPNYAPEPIGIAPLVTDACEWLAARGHEVEVVTAVPNYPERRIHAPYRGRLWVAERRGSVVLSRSWLRVRPRERFIDKALYELSFAAASLPQALRRMPHADVILTLVPTLLSTVAAGAVVRAIRVARPGPRLVVWLQDLVLGGALALDGLGAASRGVLTASALAERTAMRSADRIISCSPGFHDYLLRHGITTPVETILNWVDIDAIRAAPPRDDSGCVRFLYAGNLGYSQGFETLVDAAARVSDVAHVEIVGAGNAGEYVRTLAGVVPNVEVTSPVPAPEFPLLLARADVHVVIQRAVSAGANMPSKIGPYLASGRPIIASLDPSTPAAELLRASGAALIVPAERPGELAEAMAALARDRELRKRLGRAGRSFAERELSRESLLPRLERALSP